MGPESRGKMQMIQQELAQPTTTPERAKELCKMAVNLVRSDRGIIATAIEAKRPAKRAAKVDGASILNDFLGESPKEQESE